jgi:hypothetical protein
LDSDYAPQKKIPAKKSTKKFEAMKKSDDAVLILDEDQN